MNKGRLINFKHNTYNKNVNNKLIDLIKTKLNNNKIEIVAAG